MTVNRHPLAPGFGRCGVALIAGCMLAGTALAQTTTGPTPARAPLMAASSQFQQADQNGDGQLSRSEAAMVPGLEAAFDKLDADRNGSLSAGEFDKAAKD